jgi:hypothetical protein
VLGGILDFFPHSPAKKGPLGPSGWRQLRTSGLATMHQFAEGAKDGAPAYADALTAAAAAVSSRAQDALAVVSTRTSVDATSTAATTAAAPAAPGVAFYGDVHTQDVDELVDRIEKKKRAANYATGATRKVG